MNKMPREKRIVKNAAGFWARMMAGLVDASLIFLFWYLIADFLYHQTYPFGDFYGSLRYDIIGADFQTSRMFGSSFFALLANDFIANESQYLLRASCISFCFAWAYSAVMEACPWHATIGKRVVGITVIHVNTKPVSAYQAIVRGISKTISVLPAFSGIIAIGLSDDKRSFHDRICQTLVIKDRNRYWFQKKELPMHKATKINITNSQGVVLSLAEHMQNVSTQVTQNLKRSDQTPEITQLLELLIGQIKDISDKIPTDTVAKMTKNVTRLSEDLSTKSPDKNWCKLSLTGIKEAAEAVGAIGKPILEVVLKLWPLIL